VLDDSRIRRSGEALRLALQPQDPERRDRTLKAFQAELADRLRIDELGNRRMDALADENLSALRFSA
jgi:hypothetical protein